MKTVYPAPWHIKLYNRIDNVAGKLFCRMFGHWFVWKTEIQGTCMRCHTYLSVHAPDISQEHFAAIVGELNRSRARRARPAPR